MKAKSPKYVVMSGPKAMTILANALSGKSVVPPKGTNYMIFPRDGEWEEPLYIVQSESNPNDMDVLVEDGEVVFTDEHGVKCLRASLTASERTRLLFKKLFTVDTAPLKEAPKGKRRGSSMNVIADAINPTTGAWVGEHTQFSLHYYSTMQTPPIGDMAMRVINQRGVNLQWPEKRAGFWRKKVKHNGETLPFPVITSADGYDQGAFLKTLTRMEKRATKRAMRGTSKHRWYGTANGCAEFSFNGWKWPEGYRTYLEAGVLPSREFYRFVTNKDLVTLPSYKENDCA